MIDFDAVTELAIDAGHAIMEVYGRTGAIDFETKGDESPLTEADLAANEVIANGLARLTPEIPIVSEEGNVGDPSDTPLCWLVDPLDGTKEFIKRNGMFTVNIALMKRRGSRWGPVFGVVHAPATNTTWRGGTTVPAERNGPDGSGLIMVKPTHPNKPTRLVASGSHRGTKDEAFAHALGDHELIRMGSSLKACVVAEGGADLYPRFGPTSCWDIAAAHSVVTAAGGTVLGPDGKTLDYDVIQDVLNPFFLVTSDERWIDRWVEAQ
tara:strand:- start:1489 stop:2286 length:798 start_codon:yes stop_codon:yes gene_type:complete